MGKLVALPGFIGGYDAPWHDGQSVAVSTNGGVSWTLGLLPAAERWVDAAWNGSVFCAVATETAIAATSPDGRVWTQRTLPTPPNGDLAWNVIAWNGKVFCAVTESSSNWGVIASPDGVTWSQGYLQDHGGMFIAALGETLVTADNPTYSHTSTDGVTWTEHLNAFSAPGGWNGAASNGQTICVTGIPFNGTTNSAVTSDGITFTTSAPLVSGAWTAPAWNGSVWCALVGHGDAFTSTDGLVWAQHTVPALAPWQALAWDGDVFCGLGAEGTVITSPDGITWTQRAGFSSIAPGVAWTRVVSDTRTPGVSYPLSASLISSVGGVVAVGGARHSGSIVTVS
jgi:hypothetical protein